MEKLLKPRDVAERLSVSIKTVYYLIKSKQLVCVQVSPGALRVEEQELKKYIESNKRNDSTRPA